METRREQKSRNKKGNNGIVDSVIRRGKKLRTAQRQRRNQHLSVTGEKNRSKRPGGGTRELQIQKGVETGWERRVLSLPSPKKKGEEREERTKKEATDAYYRTRDRSKQNLSPVRNHMGKKY